MAIQIPIISEFDGKGISKAVAEFKQLEGASAKTQYAIKKAAIPAAAALGGIAVALGDATKAAMEDAAAQATLARTVKEATGATDGGVKVMEDWISATSKAKAVSDDELRPAIGKLIRQTHDFDEAQRGVNLALDISAATGKDLSTVTTALEKAYGGNTKALAKLSPELKDMIKNGMSLDEALGVLEGSFAGAADTAANTAEGGFKKLGISIAETKESIGAALLPVVEKVIPKLQGIADWAQDNPQKFVAIAGSIAGVSAALIAANVAMSAWGVVTALTTTLNTQLATSFTAIQVASGLIVFTALIAGLVVAYKKFEWFRDGVRAVVDGVVGYFETLINGWIMVINGVIRAWNLVPGHKDIGTLSHVTLGRVGQDNGSGGGGMKIPAMAQGGIVTSPTLALIGEAGPEAVVPLSKMNQMGGGVTINVNGGDPNAVVDTLRRYYRQNGPIPVGVAY